MKKKWPHLVLGILTLLIIAFIFSNSLPSVSVSSAQSGQVLEWLRPLLELFFGEATNHLVRKLAHLAEFFALGLGLKLFFGRKQPFTLPLLIAVLVALTDETIQIFTDRGPQVQDVWLDIAGSLGGMALGYVIQRFGKKKDKIN